MMGYWAFQVVPTPDSTHEDDEATSSARRKRRRQPGATDEPKAKGGRPERQLVVGDLGQTVASFVLIFGREGCHGVLRLVNLCYAVHFRGSVCLAVGLLVCAFVMRLFLD